jgi:hypothetical protein
MNYNFEETDIINEIYNSYLSNNDYESELKQLIYEIIIYNDKSNIEELIQKYGGIYYLTNLYNSKYKSINYPDLPLYDLLAYVGLYDYIYNKINELIILDFNLRIIN